MNDTEKLVEREATHRDGPPHAPKRTLAGLDRGAAGRPEYTDPIDDALEDSFPASDPPPWTGGIPSTDRPPRGAAVARPPAP